MTKIQLEEILILIAKEYKPTPEKPVNLKCNIKAFSDALNNDDLEGYLIDMEICIDDSEIDEYVNKYSTATGIIEEFINDMDLLTYEWNFYTNKE